MEAGQTARQELGEGELGGGSLQTEPGGTSLGAGRERRGLGIELGACANEARTGEPPQDLEGLGRRREMDID